MYERIYCPGVRIDNLTVGSNDIASIDNKNFYTWDLASPVTELVQQPRHNSVSPMFLLF